MKDPGAGGDAVKPYYDEGGITIYHGDCRDVLPRLHADLVFADPPYGVGLPYGQHTDVGGDQYVAFVAEVADLVRASAPVALVTPGIRNLWLWPPATWVLCWGKPGSTRRSDLGGFNEWEPVLMYGKRLLRRGDSWRLPDCANHTRDAGDHPCPKPVRLLTWLVESFSDPGATVIDPFVGSGTDDDMTALIAEVERPREIEAAVREVRSGGIEC